MFFWEFKFDAISWQMMLELMLRVVAAGICGAIVGFERTKRLKEAGLRTHCVVAIASCLMMIISKYGFADLALYDAAGNLINDGFFAGTKGADPSRIASQIVSGVGFLGAGVIFKNGNVVRGITTAAGIWATAGIGMAFGSGMYILGVFVTLFIMIVQIILHRFPVGNDALNTSEIKILMKDTPASREMIKKRREDDWALLVGCKTFTEGGNRMVQVIIKASHDLTPEAMMRLMDENPDIVSISK